MLGTLALAGIAGALMSNPGKRRRRSPGILRKKVAKGQADWIARQLWDGSSDPRSFAELRKDVMALVRSGKREKLYGGGGFGPEVYASLEASDVTEPLLRQVERKLNALCASAAGANSEYGYDAHSVRRLHMNPGRKDALLKLIAENWPEFKSGAEVDHNELFEWMRERMTFASNRNSPSGKFLLRAFPGLKPRSRAEVNSVDLVDEVSALMSTSLADYITAQNDAHGPWSDPRDLLAAAHNQRAVETGVCDYPTDADRGLAKSLIATSAAARYRRELRVRGAKLRNPGKNGYVCFYRGKRLEVYADTTAEAQQIAAEKFKAKKRWEVDVMLAEKGGDPVVHTAVNPRRRNPGLFDGIRRGDSVTIRAPQGHTSTGKAYLLGPSGWVLGAGPHGSRVTIATPTNVVSVRKGRTK